MKKILLFMPFLAMTFTQAQVSLVKDINPGAGDGVANYTLNRIGYNNQLYFSATDGVNGYELWKSDGTFAGTQLIDLQLNTGESSYPNGFFYSNSTNEVYFSATTHQTSVIDYELWKIDTSGIPSKIVELFVSGAGNPQYFTEYSNKVYFSAASDFNNNQVGVEVHFTDGTASGTNVLKDINQTTFNLGVNPDNYSVSNGKLFFVALINAPANIPVTGQELYVSDGTEIGTDLLFDINSGPANSSPEYLTDLNNKLYFVADDGINGRELWLTDGTTSGTQRLFDINPIAGDLDNPENLIVFNNALYFTASHPTLGNEIFKLGGTTITNLKNIASGSGNSNPANLFVSNGKLYFSANNGVNGIELWSSNGFSTGTNMLKDINTDAATPDSNPNGFTEYFGELYFTANDGVNGRELWKTDGTNAGTILVHDINSSGDSNPSDLIVANNRLFFSANDGSTGIELWKYQDPTLSIEESQTENIIAIHPNPVSNSFSIETNNIIDSVTIYDVQGKLVKTFSHQLDSYTISDLNSGLYFARIESDKGEITKKLIKE